MKTGLLVVDRWVITFSI